MSLAYRPNVCMLVYNPLHELWLGQRWGASTWQFPQGGADPQRPLEESVVRELQEELGLLPQHLGQILPLQARHRYEFERTPAHWQGKWIGQDQSFWAVEFLGSDEVIDLAQHQPQEFSHWRWCPLDEIEERVDPVRRPGYREPLKEFCNKVAKR